VVDLAFREDTPDFMLDFKTDREFATSSDRYTAQVSAYSKAIQAATDLLSRGIVLVV
jgi:ATP-dependent exoDNAse (exonuclease V) beta subunit